MKAQCKNRYGAFSLIELLLGVALIAILAAILFPGAEKAMYESRKSKSIGNLRTISSALFSYTNDHNGKLPEGAFRPTLKGVTVRYWYNALDFYVGGKDNLPENSRLGTRPNWQNDPLKTYPAPIFDGGFAVNVGYGWNHAYFGYTPTWYPESLGWGGRLSEIEIPSQSIIIGTNTDLTDASVGIGNVLIYASAGAAKRYKNKGLYLLLDGHVASFSPDEILANNSYLFRKRKPALP